VKSLDPYDVTPYTDHAYAESHPERLASVARLNRFQPADLGSAHVLEIACGRGGNLLSMAAGMPSAQFVGIDRSPRQIDEATEIARACRLENVELRSTDFETLETGSGEFDYVLAHGLVSWISPDARRSLFRVTRSRLSAHGVAYVSFNVLPGWYERLAARDWLRAFAAPDHARTSLAELIELVSPELTGYRGSLERVAARIAETDEAYITHEYFAADHHPVLVSEIIEEAEAAGLRYLGDAIPQLFAFELAPKALTQRVAGSGARDAQQLLDFARNTAFRRALFVRSDTCDAIGWRWSPELDASALGRMTATSRLRPSNVEWEVVAGDMTIQIGTAARDALAEMARVAPHAASVKPAWREELFDLWLVTRAIDLHVHAPVIEGGSSARPRACPVARWHASNGGSITNRWHQEVVLEDDVTRAVLAELDGVRTVDDIARELSQPRVLVHQVIAQLASLALLV
jgi:trans-aconitate methyltransferase